MSRKFIKGERYRPIVTVDKVRNGVPTVVIMSGRRYIYDPGTVNRHVQKKEVVNMRKRKRLWVLMYRREGRQRVWLYEPLRKKEIGRKQKHGWRLWK